MALLILLPAAIQTDWYEITNPLLIMGLPMVVLGAAIGALVGVRGRADSPGTGGTHRPLAVGMAVASALAVWLLLWGTGAISTPPLGIG